MSPADALTVEQDQAFVELLVNHDAGAWRRLFDSSFHEVYAFAYARTGDSHLAEDIAAEVFCEAAHGIDRFHYRGIPIKAWLFRIARNVTVDELKRRKRQRSLSLEANSWLEELAQQEAVDPDTWRDFCGALRQLKREHQEVLLLRFVHGLPLAEVAQATGRSVGAVKLLQRRAAASLRKGLRA